MVTAGIAIVVLAVGAFIMSQNASSNDPMTNDARMGEQKEAGAMMQADGTKMEDAGAEESMMKDDAMMGDDGMMKENQRYVPYSATALDDTASQRRILFFYANWCPTCRPADADFEAKQNTFPSDVALIRVNYNDTETDQEEKGLAQKYGVTYQHTFVEIDANGKAVQTWNGGQTAELLSRVN